MNQAIVTVTTKLSVPVPVETMSSGDIAMPSTLAPTTTTGRDTTQSVLFLPVLPVEVKSLLRLFLQLPQHLPVVLLLTMTMMTRTTMKT